MVECLNPYVLNVTPCGSSSGSATAIAASLASVAVGTETDGSIVCPASVNSVVGIKPTVGLVSRAGVIPISHSQDTVGPFGRTVADAAALLGALVGTDPQRSSDPGRQRHHGLHAVPRPGRTARHAHRGASLGVLGEQREEQRDSGVGGGPAEAIKELKSLIQPTSPRPRRY